MAKKVDGAIAYKHIINAAELNMHEPVSEQFLIQYHLSNGEIVYRVPLILEVPLFYKEYRSQTIPNFVLQT